MAKTMIKLRLKPPDANFASVQNLPGLTGLILDPGFGLVPLDPRRGLYAVRVDQMNDLARRREISPEIMESYGDVRISTTGGTT
jgi:hypothetical protein